MKRLTLATLLLCLYTIALQAAWVNPNIIRDITLPVVWIHTVDRQEPVAESVSAPKGCLGMGITGANKVGCRVVITQLQDTLYDSGPYLKDSTGATVKVTGNSSALFYNKPYKLKLEKKADLLFRGDKRYKDKDWRLAKDATSLNTMLGLWVSRRVGMPWTPACQPCNVILNDDYKGCYLILESVDRNKDCRIDVDKQQGYIVERDPYWWNDHPHFETPFFADTVLYRWTWKHPDEDEYTAPQEEYIQSRLTQLEQRLDSGAYEDLMDLRSWAAYLLAHDILAIYDAGGANMFVAKRDESDSTRLFIPCLWDFDTAMGVDQGVFSITHHRRTASYYPRLLASRNAAFRAAYKQLWREVRPNIYNDLMTWLTALVETPEMQALNLSRTQYTRRWYYYLRTVEYDASVIIYYMRQHLASLDTLIEGIDDGAAGIGGTAADQAPPTLSGSREYSLAGRPATRRDRLVVSQGKVVMR